MVTLDLDKKIRINKNILWREVEGETVALNSDNSDYYVLNATGSRIWKLFDAKHTLGDIVDALCTQYDAEKSKVVKDLKKLIQELSKEQLIQII